MHASCSGCRGECCLVYRVPVNGADLRRLSNALQAPPHALAALIEVDPSDRGAIRLDDSGRHWSLHLYEREDACAMVVRLADGTARCGVYEHRPGACRMYPAAIDDDGRTVMRAGAACERNGGCGFDAEPLSSWTERIERCEAEWEEYEQALERWERLRREHAQDPTPPSFLAWVTETYTT